MRLIDVVVVAYNSRAGLRECVAPLAGAPGIHVIVVDNASPDRSIEAVAGLPVTPVLRERNLGFAAGCNAGWRAGSAPLVLFLNPDARLEPRDLSRLAEALDADPAVAIAGPRVVDGGGRLDRSIRRFPRLRSSFAQALFLHRLLPGAAWVDEVVRDPVAYEAPHDVDWLSGACMLVRRSLLERLGGWDEGFFLYSEDTDICRRAWDAGARVRFEPAATCLHEGGGSGPRSELLPVLAKSRLRYARVHHGVVVAALERATVVVGAVTHAIASTKGRAVRRGHARTLAAVLRPERRGGA